MRRASRPAVFVLLALMAVGLCSCGYQFAGSGSKAPFVLPQEYSKLWFKGVENPTVETWLGSTIRSLLRDEITNRGQAQWVDKDEADAYLEVTVQHFSHETKVSGDNDESLKYSASISMVVSIRSARTGKQLWSSGKVSASESFYGAETYQARLSAVELAVERAVDRMSQNY